MRACGYGGALRSMEMESVEDPPKVPSTILRASMATRQRFRCVGMRVQHGDTPTHVWSIWWVPKCAGAAAILAPRSGKSGFFWEDPFQTELAALVFAITYGARHHRKGP